MFFSYGTAAVATIITASVGAAVATGIVLGRWLRERNPRLHSSIGVVQGALFGLVGLLLAFGLSMAVDRYEHRRAATVDEANAIGSVEQTAVLLQDPFRTRTLELLTGYAAAAVRFSETVPGSNEFDDAQADISTTFDELWSEAGRIVTQDPTGTVPLLHLEALGDASNAHTVRSEALANRLPDEVTALLFFAVVLTLGVLGIHLTVVGRGLVSSIASAVVVVLILMVMFDLDRPHRGLITVPDTSLVAVHDGLTATPPD